MGAKGAKHLEHKSEKSAKMILKIQNKVIFTHSDTSIYQTADLRPGKCCVL